MLSELSVKDLGVIQQAKLEFSEGLSVITGETGAGKSLLLTGLRLLMGARSDTKVVRTGAARATVDGVWTITNSQALNELAEREIELEDNELFVNRFIQEDGKSRLILGGRNTPTSAMGEIADLLVEIHGQSDQLKLKDPVIQRDILDSFGGIKLAKASELYSSSYASWKKLQRKIKDLEENSSKREIELRYNQELVKRYLDLAPEEDELTDLEAEIEKIAHLEDISDGMREALALVLPEELDSPFSMLNQATALLWKLSKYDSKLSEIADLIDSGLKNIEPGLQELENYVDDIDLESLQKLHELEDRLRDLKIFAKPFGGDLNKAIEECDKAQEALNESEADLDLDSLKEELATLFSTVESAGAVLTAERETAALALSKAINEELADLAMRSTELVVEVSPKAPAQDGADLVSFMVETKGANRRPIIKAASGGELSRIMLALEVVTARDAVKGTLIFDEIDSGIGGATAIEVGKKLAKLAKNHQVIVVSHLPQVACWAEEQFVITKDDSGEFVTTSVHKVAGDERVKEIARMLSGLADSDTGLAHAEELLATANEEKSKF